MTQQYHMLAAPIVLTSANNVIQIREDGGSVLPATIAAGTYYLYGQETGEAGDISDAIITALTALAGPNTYAMSLSWRINASALTCIVSIRTSGTSVQIINSGTTFDLAQIGFAQADSAAAASIVGTVSPSRSWVANVPSAMPYGQTFANAAKQHRTASGRVYTFAPRSTMEKRRLRWENVAGVRTKRNIATSADYARAFQSFWREITDGLAVRVYGMLKTGASSSALIDPTSADLVGSYRLDSGGTVVFNPRRQPGADVWSWDLDLLADV